MAARGLRCCLQAFSSYSEQGLCFISVLEYLIVEASLVSEQRLQAHRLQYLWLENTRAQV